MTIFFTSVSKSIHGGEGRCEKKVNAFLFTRTPSLTVKDLRGICDYNREYMRMEQLDFGGTTRLTCNPDCRCITMTFVGGSSTKQALKIEEYL